MLIPIDFTYFLASALSLFLAFLSHSFTAFSTSAELARRVLEFILTASYKKSYETNMHSNFFLLNLYDYYHIPMTKSFKTDFENGHFLPRDPSQLNLSAKLSSINEFIIRRVHSPASFPPCNPNLATYKKKPKSACKIDPV